MKSIWIATAFAASTAFAAPSHAALAVGAKAPDFTVQAALDGKPFRYTLAQALAKGPVVLYFFPASFTSGCSAEAHAFAEAIGRFEALGATVIGVSGDDLATQVKFSSQVCQGKFPVAADADRAVIRGYDAAMLLLPDVANRISYVIAPDRSVVYAYQSLNPELHVENTLAALRRWGAARATK